MISQIEPTVPNVLEVSFSGGSSLIKCLNSEKTEKKNVLQGNKDSKVWNLEVDYKETVRRRRQI